MIPVKITLTNFMCYRNPTTLDLTGVHVACLSGDNGAGKSALLDAMTWALWGKGRAKSDDDFIALGQKETEVDFEFLLGDNQYRVLRRRIKRSSAGQSILEFQVRDGESWRSITGNMIRDTQTKITSLLRMDYETFINSAFILQGRADEFTIKTPGERKRILADILGLSYYDRLEETARLAVREHDQALRSLHDQIEEIEAQIQLKPQWEELLRTAASSLVVLDRDVDDLQESLQVARERENELEFKFEQIADFNAHLQRYQRELAEARRRADEHERRLADCQALLSRRQEITEGYEAIRSAREREAQLGRKLSSLFALNRRRTELERAINDAKGHLTTQQQILSREMSDQQKASEKGHPLRIELEKMQASLAQAHCLEEERNRSQEAILEATATIHRLQAGNETLKREIGELKRRIDMLQESEAACPLCGNSLGDLDRRGILDSFETEGKAKADTFRGNAAEIEESQRRIAAEQSHLKKLDLQITERRQLERREAILLKGIDDAGQAEQQLAAAQVKLVMITERLAKRDYAPAEQAALAQVLDEIRSLDYDEVEHQAARSKLKELERFEDLYNRMQAAVKEEPQERAALGEAREAESRWVATLQEDTARRDALLNEVAGLPQARQRVAELAGNLDIMVRQQTEVRDRFSRAQAGLEHCVELEKIKRQKTNSYDLAAQQKAIYQELAVAFGKKGIQAMIIESAIPEIEDEANDLLSRMTEGRMHVKFETQHDTKKGDTIETLDIRISDGIGTRNYELYSGGESFRANFAIRIALSKLLARRAGARLQTLVIDEGFGTQDDQGRDRLVEAINSIQDEFEKVLVVTHIQELKDAFPVRIDISKTLEGSQILVN